MTDHSHFMWHASSGDEELPLQELWTRLPRAFEELLRSEPFTLRAFVLMGNHFHGLAGIESEPDVFGRKVSDAVANGLGLDPAGFTSIAITEFKHYLTTYKYIYRNPVEAGRAPRAQDYEYSTLGEQLGLRPPLYRTVDNMNLIQDQKRVLGWLNNQNELFYPSPSFEAP